MASREETIAYLLHRAVRELEYVRIANDEERNHLPQNRYLIASDEGAEIIRDGMAVLGLADLSAEPRP